LSNTTDPWKALPQGRQREIEAQMEPGENLLTSFEPDLDSTLHYAPGLVLLTDRRILSREPADGADPRWQAWPLAPDVTLQSHERTGVGLLELSGPAGRLACWRYAAGRAASARHLAQRLAALHASRAGNGTAAVETVCPSCGATIRAEDGQCTACAPAPNRASVSALFRLTRFARPVARIIVLGFCLTLASTAVGLVPPGLTKPLIDNVLIPLQENQQGVPVDRIAWYLGGLVAAALVGWLLDWGRLFTTSWVSERVSAELRSQTYAHLQRLSVEFFGGKRTGDLIARISNDTERLCNFLSLNLVDFATDILMILMTAAILLAMDPVLALAALCPFPVIVWLVYRVRGRLLRGYRQAGVAWGDMTSVLADTIPGIRVVKAFAQEQREIRRFDCSNDWVFQANNRLNRTWSVFGPTVTLLTTGGLLVVWSFASWRVYHHWITVGTLTAFLAYISRFYARMESMIRFSTATQRAAASAQRLFEILDRVPSVPEPARPVDPGRLAGRIELKGVRFKYGSREVLHGLDLHIEPGEMIGLVGPSGAGKTTLLNLICRFYDVAAGAILVDGVDVRSFPVEAYRRNIGIVLQDPFLFYGTIAENIAYGRPDATREEIVVAARAARAHEFILRLPDGYDSLVGERGQSLSGGERQRISIARALLIDPRILILDEATSSVDTETERQIQAALETLIQGRTTIAIAHRLSTLRRANRLVVVERGQIAEIGSHDDLLRAERTYARLHRAQVEVTQGCGV
jgi:ATP-binding cassette subfamily B protein